MNQHTANTPAFDVRENPHPSNPKHFRPQEWIAALPIECDHAEEIRVTVEGLFHDQHGNSWCQEMESATQVHQKIHCPDPHETLEGFMVSVYVRRTCTDPGENPIDCIADFSTLDNALNYANVVGRLLGAPVENCADDAVQGLIEAGFALQNPAR